MSRIGKMPIVIPEDVTIDVTTDNEIIISNAKATLRQWFDSKYISIERKSLDGKNVLVVTRKDDSKQSKSKHGLYRTLIANMIKGVTEGFSKTLLVNGVGYKCALNGDKLVLNIGFSHPVRFNVPQEVKITCVTPTEIKVEGHSKELVGQVAADIKALKPVEPYHAYGIRYSDQRVIRKEIKKTTKKK